MSSASKRLRPPSMWVVFSNGILGKIWKKSQPFSHAQKRKHLSNPIRITQSLLFVRNTPFHRWARSKRRSNKLHRLVPEFHNEQDVLRHYEQLSSDCDAARSKIQELQNQAKEHELVVDAIKDLDPKGSVFDKSVACWWKGK